MTSLFSELYDEVEYQRSPVNAKSSALPLPFSCVP